jgi:hypothetical protein
VGQNLYLKEAARAELLGEVSKGVQSNDPRPLVVQRADGLVHKLPPCHRSKSDFRRRWTLLESSQHQIWCRYVHLVRGQSQLWDGSSWVLVLQSCSLVYAIQPYLSSSMYLPGPDAVEQANQMEGSLGLPTTSFSLHTETKSVRL